MNPLSKIAEFTPLEFEKHVQSMLVTSGVKLDDFSATNRERIKAHDGEYEIDVVARFTAFGSEYLTLVECKHHKNPIKRDVVSLLKDKLYSTGAQKGMIFSTVRFQSGAVLYAKQHGIALIQVTDSEPIIYNRAEGFPSNQDTRQGAWLVDINADEQVSYSIMGLYEPEKLYAMLGITE